MDKPGGNGEGKRELLSGETPEGDTGEDQERPERCESYVHLKFGRKKMKLLVRRHFFALMHDQMEGEVNSGRHR